MNVEYLDEYPYRRTTGQLGAFTAYLCIESLTY